MAHKSEKFQHLVELADIVNRYKTKQINIITQPTTLEEKTNRYWDYYVNLTNNNFANDQDAIEYFQLENNIRSYKSLREGVKDRLINTLFFMNLNDDSFDSYSKILYQTRKDYTAFLIIYGRGGRTLGIQMGKNILRIALKYQFTDMIISVSSYLKDYFSKDIKLQNQFEKYNDLMWKYRDIERNELKAAEFYQRFIMSYIGKKADQPEKYKQAKTYIDELDRIPKTMKSEKFYRFYFLLSIYISMSQNHWENTIVAVEKGIQYYDSHPHFPRRIISSFLLQKITAEIMLKQYDNALSDITRAIEYVPAHSKTWMKLKEFRVQIYFLRQEYKLAWNLIKTIIRHPRFSSLSQSHKEMWYIYNAYISLAQLLNKVKLSPREIGYFNKFRLSKFINEVPNYSKDKKGVNISIIIVQILILLQQKKYHELDHKIEAFMKYKSRRLSSISSRTDFFIKIINSLRICSYQKKQFIKKSKPYYNKMVGVKTNLLDKVQEFEVIPYEILYDFIIEMISD